MVMLSPEELQARWLDLNTRYYAGLLPPISIVWTRRLTSSTGMFTSRGDPRSPQLDTTGRSHREILLSLPLLERLAERTPYAEQELLNTLAHEMIHQWQFDVLKRRPNHGLDFLRKMTEINRSGAVAITTYHSLQKEVLAMSRFVWHCRNCGHIYRRQRKTIKPKRHRCGACHGSLQELIPVMPPLPNQTVCRVANQSGKWSPPSRPVGSDRSPEQLTLALA